MSDLQAENDKCSVVIQQEVLRQALCRTCQSIENYRKKLKRQGSDVSVSFLVGFSLVSIYGGV